MSIALKLKSLAKAIQIVVKIADVFSVRTTQTTAKTITYKK